MSTFDLSAIQPRPAKRHWRKWVIGMCILAALGGVGSRAYNAVLSPTAQMRHKWDGLDPGDRTLLCLGYALVPNDPTWAERLDGTSGEQFRDFMREHC